MEVLNERKIIWIDCRIYNGTQKKTLNHLKDIIMACCPRLYLHEN